MKNVKWRQLGLGLALGLLGAFLYTSQPAECTAKAEVPLRCVER